MSKPKLNRFQAQHLLNQYHAGNLSKAAFLAKHGAGPSLFSYWLPRLKPSSSQHSPRFQEIALPAAAPQGPCLLTLPSGAKLEFPASHLAEALTLLTSKEAAC
jgi:hypothetical protein